MKTKRPPLEVLLDQDQPTAKRVEAANAVAAEVAKAGGRCPDDEGGRTADLLFAVLEEAEPDLGQATAAALRAMKGLAADLAKRAAAEPDGAARAWLVRRLAWLRDATEAGAAALAAFLDDSVGRVRREAVRGLSMLPPTPRSLAALLAALHDPSHELRALAAGGLAELGRRDEKARGATVPALRAALEDDEDETARDFMKGALRTLGAL